MMLGGLIEELGHPPVLAMTATAALPVREEIVLRLGMNAPALIGDSLLRTNLELSVVRFDDPSQKLPWLIEAVSERLDFPGIVYTATRAHAEAVASAMAESGLRAEAYHAGLSGKVRDSIQNRFMQDDMDVIVATKAFGLGVNKTNVRFVIHFEVSDSPDAYFQEIGRGGRDGETAQAILMYAPADLARQRFFASGKLREEDATVVLAVLAAKDGKVGLDELAAASGFSDRKGYANRQRAR